MKHRSVVIFTVLLMGLAVMPQAARQLTTLRDAAGNNLQAGIWNLFLSYHAQKISGDEPPQSNALVTSQSCLETAKVPVQVVPNIRKNDDAPPQRSRATQNQNPRKHSKVENADLPLDFIASNFVALESEPRMINVSAPVVANLPVALALPAPRELRESVPAVADRGAARRELNIAATEREAMRYAAQFAGRALWTKERARETRRQLEDVLKINFVAPQGDGGANPNAPRIRIRNKVIFRPSVQKATGTGLALNTCCRAQTVGLKQRVS